MPTQYLFPLLVKALEFSKGTIICPLSVRVPGLKHQITDKWHFYLTGATENCKTPCYDFCWDYWEEKNRYSPCVSLGGLPKAVSPRGETLTKDGTHTQESGEERQKSRTQS